MQLDDQEVICLTKSLHQKNFEKFFFIFNKPSYNYIFNQKFQFLVTIILSFPFVINTSNDLLTKFLT